MRIVGLACVLGACGFAAPAGTTTDGVAPPDAAGTVDGRAPWTVESCPESYVQIATLASRYRIDVAPDSFQVQHARCMADSPGRTHLATLSDLTELGAVHAAITAREDLPPLEVLPQLTVVYIGGLQRPGQTDRKEGWLGFDGAPFIADQWVLGQPDDGGDFTEDDEDNYAVLFRTYEFLGDIHPSYRNGALCECDGSPVSPAVLDIISTDSARR